jgi:hypothetical protein
MPLSKAKSLKSISLFLFTGAMLAACATAGRSFNETRYDEIVEKVTNKKELQAMLGEPNSKLRATPDANGCGGESWTYTRAYLVVVAGGKAKELNVKFDQNGIVCGKSLKETHL